MPPVSNTKDKLLRHVIAVAGIALTIYLVVLIWNGVTAHGQIGLEPRTRDTFTIEGEGKVSAQPTLAEVDLGLYSEGRDVSTVQQTNAGKINTIIAALKQMGIADADIQTTNYNISPKFDYSEGTQNVIGYTVSQNMEVKVRNLSNVGAVLSKAGELGANQVNDVRFTIDDPTEMRQQARTKAIDDAKNKADELAKAMGVRIVKIVTFSESSTGTEPPPIFYQGLEASPIPSSVPNIQSGELDVQSHVSVTFEMR
jgi:hypothetical protein